MPSPCPAPLPPLQANVLSDGSKDDPVLSRFEQQITKYKGVATEIASLPAMQVRGCLSCSGVALC